MVASLEQIQQDLSRLRQKSTQLATKLSEAYNSYLEILGESVQKQIVLACFNLCTERHAQAFLSLSLTERQRLQQDIQKLGVELDQSLRDLLGDEHCLRTHPDEIDPPDLLEAVTGIEARMGELLRSTSLEINRLLEQQNILQIKSLDTLFEIATKAEEAGRSITNPPLFLKAIIDMKEEESAHHHPLTAIYLQVGDLEFADPIVQGARHTLRQLTQQLFQLEKAYDEKLEEADVAEAIAAWRAAWFPYPSNS